MISRLYRYATPLVIALAFALWFVLFSPFIFNRLALVNDAVAYFMHTRFFLQNLESGVFPLWDPDWFAGAPVDFFLRRIGNHNPFYLLIFVLHKAGLPFRIAYLLFLVFYFYLGMIGFYMLSRTLIADKRAALVAFLLLCFSSLGTMLFFSFLHVIYVPLFWFFYFLVSFFRRPAKVYLLGLTFTSMLIVSTYIPFYAGLILAAFLVFFACLYPCALAIAVKGAFLFLAQHKALSLLCAAALAGACLPQAMLFASSSDGQVTMPARHQGSQESSIYTVSTKKVVGGDAISQLYFDRLFRHHDKMELGVVYFPLAGYFIFLLGLFIKIEKRVILLSLMAFFLFLVSITELSPIHGWLYQYLFVLKFIRQSYFFFWIAILPILALLVAMQLENILKQTRLRSKAVSALVVLGISSVSFGYLVRGGGVAPVSYLVWTLAAVLSLGMALSERLKERIVAEKGMLAFLLVIFALIALDAADALRHIPYNEMKTPSNYRWADDEPQNVFDYERYKGRVSSESSKAEAQLDVRGTELYYASEGYTYLYQNADQNLLNRYLNYKFVLYDGVQLVRREEADTPLIDRILGFEETLAAVEVKDALEAAATPATARPIPLAAASPMFEVIKFNANQVEARADLQRPKFLVYNDSFHKDWRVSVNGEERPLYRANVGFKGVWLPAGESIVIFRFKTMGRYFFDYVLSAVFWAVFIALALTGKNDIARALGDAS